MEYRQHHTLNPLAMAIAAGASALIISAFVGLSMTGFGGMMGGHQGGYFGSGWMMGGQQGGHFGPGWMMGGYGNRSMIGFGIMWIVCAAIAAIVGAIFAWVYNCVNAAQSNKAIGPEPEAGSHLRESR